MLFKHTLGYGKFFSPDVDGGGAGGSGTGDSGDGGEGDNASGDGEGDGGDDVAGLKSALDKERTAARTAAKQLKTIQAELDNLKNAGKSDEEQRDAALKAAQDKADAAEQRLRAANARSAVTEAATKANAVSVRAVFSLIKDDLDYDDDGEPTNVAALIAQAKKDEPTLFKAAGGSGDGGKGQNGTGDTKDINAALRQFARGGS